MSLLKFNYKGTAFLCFIVLITFNLNFTSATEVSDEMVMIPAGIYEMGNSFDQGTAAEWPVHSVYVSKFYMDKYEISKQKWDDVAGWAAEHGYDISSSDATGRDPNYPVYNVSWYESIKWCNARSEKEGKQPCYYKSSSRESIYREGNLNISNNAVAWSADGYRLPTEAEWEKAARGGASGNRFPWSDTDNISHEKANYKAEGGFSYDLSDGEGYHPAWNEGRSPVGTFEENGYGLYDMAGNSWEWCWDWYHEYYLKDNYISNPLGPLSQTNRVIRGGDYQNLAYHCRAAFRFGIKPGFVEGVGFRCVSREETSSVEPIVSNVRVSQRTNTFLVDIWFDILDTKEDSYNVSVSIFSNGKVVNSQNMWGDIGSNIVPENNCHIMWDAGSDWPDHYSDDVKFKITVFENDMPSLPEDFVRVEGGSFLMGDLTGNGVENERPIHEVNVSGFGISKYEVTNADLRDVLQWAYDHGHVDLPFNDHDVYETIGNGNRLLVDLDNNDLTWDGVYFGCAENKEDVACSQINWFGANAYCNFLSRMYGLEPHCDMGRSIEWIGNWDASGFRLPTEAEWEYAARGGRMSRQTTYAGSNDLNSVGWYSSNSDGEPVLVGGKSPNELGVYDMSGNVAEWCWDVYGPYRYIPKTDPVNCATSLNTRVIRGGSFYHDKDDLRLSCRLKGDFYQYYVDAGIRVVLPFPEIGSAVSRAVAIDTKKSLDVEIAISSAPSEMLLGNQLEIEAVVSNEVGNVSYGWDLDGDNAFDDGYSRNISTHYDNEGTHIIAVKATDSDSTDIAARFVVIGKAPTENEPAIEPTPDPVFGECLNSDGSSPYIFHEDKTKNGFVIITHGLNGSGTASWLTKMASAIRKRMINEGKGEPNICVFDWKNMADPSMTLGGESSRLNFIDPFSSIRNQIIDFSLIRSFAIAQGMLIAEWVHQQVNANNIDPQAPVHLIGHSAGGFVATHAAYILTAEEFGSPNPIYHEFDAIQATMLDTPFPVKRHIIGYPNPGYLERIISSLYGTLPTVVIPNNDFYQISYRSRLGNTSEVIKNATNPSLDHSYSYKWYIDTVEESFEDGFYYSPLLDHGFHNNEESMATSVEQLSQFSEINLAHDTTIKDEFINHFSVFGDVTAEGEFYTITEDANAGIFTDIAFPKHARDLKFEYRFLAPTDGDFLSVNVGTNHTLYVGPKTIVTQSNYVRGVASVREFANTTQRLTFKLNSRGEGNAVIGIKNITLECALDSDEDGIADDVETGTGILVSSYDSGTDPANPDSDGDGANDGDELKANTDPNNPQEFPSLEITSDSLPVKMEMQAYDFQLSAINGVPPYLWAANPVPVAWGHDNYGQSTVPSGLTNVVAIAGGGYHSLALISDGTVTAWGYDNYGQSTVPSGLSNVVAIAAGRYHSLAMSSDGTVTAWGDDSYGKSTVPEGLSNVVAIAAGGYHSLALGGDGTVTAWGDDRYGQSTVPSGLSNIVAIAAGKYHSLALSNEGTVTAWGHDEHDQSTVPADLSNMVAIAAGDYHSLALSSEGTVTAWGKDGDDQSTVPAGLSNVVAIAAGREHSLVLREDGSVEAWGNAWEKLNQVPDALTNVVAIAAGDIHNLVLTSDQTRLPDGISFSCRGRLTGRPLLTSSNSLGLVVYDSRGAREKKEMELVIEPNPNTRPAVDSGTPSPGSFYMKEASSNTFSVSATDPEGADLEYRWTLNGNEVATGTDTYNFDVDWGAAGPYDLRCYVSDDLWTNIVYAEWDIDVQDIPLEITTDTLSDGMEMVEYSEQLAATNGVAPYRWAVSPTVEAWGDNEHNQSSVPANLSNVASIAAGYLHSLALLSDGTVTAWGHNSYGQSTVPERLSNVASIAAGYWHSLALLSDGTVTAWGHDNYGQITVPASTSDVMAIAGGRHHSLALGSDGTVTAWGRDNYGQITVPAGLSNVVAIAAGGSHSLALGSDGTVTAWGSDSYGQSTVPADLSNVVAIAAGDSHSLALGSDGTVTAWGHDGSGQSTVPADLSKVVAIAAGAAHNLALRRDGSIEAWGNAWQDLNQVAEALTNVVAIAAGSFHNLVLTSDQAQLPDGTSFSFDGRLTGRPLLAGTSSLDFSVFDAKGAREHKKLDLVIEPNPNTRPVIDSGTPPSGSFSMKEASSNTFSVSATDPEGSDLEYRWTLNGNEVATGTDTYNFDADWGAAGPYDLRCYVSDDLWTNIVYAEWDIDVQDIPLEITTDTLSDGMEMVPYEAQLSATNGVPPYLWAANPVPVAWGDDDYGQSKVPSGLSNVVAIAGGRHHSLALGSDGTVTAWGRDNYGQITVPAGLSNVVAIAAGGSHSLALSSDDTVTAWGYDRYGQSTVPSGLSNVVAIAAGNYHSLALSSDGTVTAWGRDNYGPSTVPADLSNVVAIAGGGYHSLALSSDGTVTAWGHDGSGQSTVPADLSKVVAIAGGDYQSLALRSDGTVTAWGNDWYGQSTVPSGLSNVVAIAGGGYHSLALSSDGTVTAWGRDSYGQSTVPADLSNVVAIAGGSYHSLALGSGEESLPEGLSLASDGILAGTPTLAGTNGLGMVVYDARGAVQTKELELVIEPNPNTRPVIDSTSPIEGGYAMNANTSSVFEVIAHDPEGVDLNYRWTWNGSNVGADSSSYAHTTGWGDAGLHRLRCYVSDDLWTNIVYAEWDVTVSNDNDADGVSNEKELDLGRDPDDPSDAGGSSSISGTVSGGGVGLEGAYVKLCGASDNVYHRTMTATGGGYTIDSVLPGHYYIKAGAPRFADEWYDDASHRTNAVSYEVPADSLLGGVDFELAGGQSPALANVTSDPTGANVYLDFQDTAEVTPVTLNLGETALRCAVTGMRLASHTVTVKMPDHPQPAPRHPAVEEAETVDIHFDLTSDATGSLSVTTTPVEADVYVDYADEVKGVSSLVVGNLAPGSHTILLRKDAYLRPRPIEAGVSAGMTNNISIPLAESSGSNDLEVEVRSVPPGASVYVDYLPTTNVTDIVVGGMDAASHGGLSWRSASHTVMLRQSGFLPSAPRYVPENTAATGRIFVNMGGDVETEVDNDENGLPDQWEDAYGLKERAPGQDGWDDDPDGDGVCNGKEMRAGTNPLDGDSVFGVSGMEHQRMGDPFSVTFNSVPGRSYIVMYADDLESGWVRASGIIVAEDYQTTWKSYGEGILDQTFFRVINLEQ